MTSTITNRQSNAVDLGPAYTLPPGPVRYMLAIGTALAVVMVSFAYFVSI